MVPELVFILMLSLGSIECCKGVAGGNNTSVLAVSLILFVLFVVVVGLLSASLESESKSWL